MLCDNGGSVKNKKCYYKYCDGIMEKKKLPRPPQVMEAYVFVTSVMVVLLHNNVFPLFFLL